MVTAALQRLKLQGSARARGQQHGSAARLAIERNLDLYQRWMRTFAGLEWTQATAHAGAYLEELASAFPSLHQELAGIAEGAEADLADIGVLHARTEIAFGASGLLAACECTAIAVDEFASADGGVYVGQNWDWLPESRENLLLLHIVREDGFEFMTFTEAGMIGKFGVNSAGIATCVNLLAANRQGPGQTFHGIGRALLEATTLSSALKVVTGCRRAGSGNVLIGSGPSGEIADLEWAPGDYAVLQDDSGVLAHANHFEAALPGLVDRTKLLATASPSTYLRAARARRLLRPSGGAISVKDLQQVLRDHRDSPESICRHPGDDPVDVASQTNLSVVFDLGRSECHVALGPPCEGDYEVVAFPWR